MTLLSEVGIKLVKGQRLEAADADVVAGSDDLIAVGALADDLRRQRHGDQTTFVRVQEFSIRDILSEDVEVLLDAGEARIVGDAQDHGEALRAVQAVVSTFGPIPVTGFSLNTLAQQSDGDAHMLLDLLSGLKEAGLSLVAEARTEQLQTPEWLEVVGQAGLRVGRLTVGDVPEHGGVGLLRRVAGWGRVVGHAHALAPLSRVLGSRPTTGYRDLRQVALARLLVDNIDSIQVDWSLYGPKLAQVALMFGANDVDMVSPLGSQGLGWRRGPLEEITKNIRASALSPVERNGCFEILKT